MAAIVAVGGIAEFVASRGKAPHHCVISNATSLSSPMPARLAVPEMPLWLAFFKKPPAQRLLTVSGALPVTIDLRHLSVGVDAGAIGGG
jgi:hypothetical protein